MSVTSPFQYSLLTLPKKPLVLCYIFLYFSSFFPQTETKYCFISIHHTMAKLTIAIFFLFFTLSFARAPLIQPENVIKDNKLLHPLLEPDATPTNQFLKETQHVQMKKNILEPKTIKALPLTFVRLRPINRHFRLPSRHPIRLCNHHFHHARYPKPRPHLPQIPRYGKEDIIRSYGDDSDIESVIFHGVRHREDNDDEEKLSRFIIKRGKHNKLDDMILEMNNQLYDPFDDEEENEGDKISEMQNEDHHSFDKKKHTKHLHPHEEEEQEAKEENQTHKEEKKKGNFMRHIRKFLDRYLD